MPVSCGHPLGRSCIRNSLLPWFSWRVKAQRAALCSGVPNFFSCSISFWFKSFVYLSVKSLAGHKEIYCLGADSTDSTAGKAMGCEVECVCVCVGPHNSGRVLFWEAPSGCCLQPPVAPRRRSVRVSRRLGQAQCFWCPHKAITPELGITELLSSVIIERAKCSQRFWYYYIFIFLIDK